ncbi:MAG: DUF1795 domain-containing protein [Myxococcales bacterium]|nr:DUF1795 domain-containing protein [Myxococcales bacterium]
MAIHLDGQLAFDVPRDWQEQTVVRYAPPQRGPGEASSQAPELALTSDAMGADETITDHAERRLHDLAKLSDGFVLRSLERADFEARPAVRAVFGASIGGVACEHHAVFVQLRERRAATLILRAPRRDLAQLEPLFQRMLASVRVAR